MGTVPNDPGTPDYAQQQPYGAPPPPGGGMGGAPAPPPTNGKATGSLVASVLGFFCGIGFIVGLILGYSARKEIQASGGQQGGEGLATAGIVIGWVGVALTILGIVAFVLLFAGGLALSA